MKKFLLTLVALCCTGLLPVAAQNYDEKLVVTINGESTDSIPASIIVEQREDGKINFVLKNFMLVAGEDVMPVGNIRLEGVDVVQEEGCKAISTNQSITIQPGDDPDILEESWIGPFLGEVPILLSGKLNDTRLYCTIDIDMMESLEQVQRGHRTAAHHQHPLRHRHRQLHHPHLHPLWPPRARHEHRQPAQRCVHCQREESDQIKAGRMRAPQSPHSAMLKTQKQLKNQQTQIKKK